MRNLTGLLVALIIFSCGSGTVLDKPVTETESMPRHDGCEQYRGAKYIKCSRELEKSCKTLINSKARSQKKGEIRDGSQVITTTEICFGDKTGPIRKCVDVKCSQYKPTFKSQVKRNGLIAGIGVVIGGVIGFAIGNKALLMLFFLL